MDFGLKDKVVIVTGAAQGIGRATALTFAEEGSKVGLADLNIEGATAVAQEIASKGGQALPIKIDFTKLADAREMVKQTIDKFGQLDVLVNVGAAWRINFFMNMTEDDWDFEIACVYRNVLNCCRAALEHMIERKSGKIVSIGSDAGRVGEPNQPVYSGAKGGVIAFNKALAKDVARHGILVNCVCPSMTVGERRVEMEQELEASGDEEAIKRYRDQMQRIIRMYPVRKLGVPQDIANMVVFLASDRANHITGQTISVNGGYCMP